MPADIVDIAKALNLSHSTVSRVLNGRGQGFISEATRQRVLQAAQEMNYRPNRAARALVTGRTQRIGLLMSGIDRPYYAIAMHHAIREITKIGYEPIIHLTYGSQETECLRDLTATTDSILVIGEHYLAGQFLNEEPQALHKPMLCCGPYWLPDVDFVGIDLTESVKKAVTHLVQSGCQRIAYLVSDWGNHPGDVRYDVYHAVMAQYNRSPEVITAPDSYSYYTRKAFREYIEQKGCPDGLFCFSDEAALGAYRAALDTGRRIPEDIALIGCDGINEMEYLATPLSTIIQPIQEMCLHACQLLQNRMTQPALPQQSVLLTAELALRQSSQR
jgi:LacI family transcriptional regulator